MATLRIHGKKWQSIIRIVGRPILAKSFQSKTDAKRWANETELKIRREDAGVAKIKFPSFRDISLRYLNEVSIQKIVIIELLNFYLSCYQFEGEIKL